MCTNLTKCANWPLMTFNNLWWSLLVFGDHPPRFYRSASLVTPHITTTQSATSSTSPLPALSTPIPAPRVHASPQTPPSPPPFPYTQLMQEPPHAPVASPVPPAPPDDIQPLTPLPQRKTTARRKTSSQPPVSTSQTVGPPPITHPSTQPFSRRSDHLTYEPSPRRLRSRNSINHIFRNL